MFEPSARNKNTTAHDVNSHLLCNLYVVLVPGRKQPPRDAVQGQQENIGEAIYDQTTLRTETALAPLMAGRRDNPHQAVTLDVRKLYDLLMSVLSARRVCRQQYSSDALLYESLCEGHTGLISFLYHLPSDNVQLLFQSYDQHTKKIQNPIIKQGRYHSRGVRVENAQPVHISRSSPS